MRLGLGDVALEPGNVLALDTPVGQIRERQIRSMNQFTERDLEMVGDCLDIAATLSSHVVKERIERLLDEGPLHLGTLGQPSGSWDGSTHGGHGQLGEIGGLAYRELPGLICLDDEETTADGITSAILHGGAEDIQAHRGIDLEVVEDGTALQIVADPLDDVVANRLEQRVAGGYP